MTWQNLRLKMMKATNYLKQERGALFVLTAMLLPVIFGFVGIAYDVGNLYMHKARLQNVTDAAALAGGEVFKNPPNKATADAEAGESVNENGEVIDTNGKVVKSPQYTDILINNKIEPQFLHQAADSVATEYITKNKINLGNNINIVELSALGYKDPLDELVSGNITTKTENTHIYYRVIATEEVQVYFLPFILRGQNQGRQVVKATSIAEIQTTTEQREEAGSGSPTLVTNPSIFDNLFTYSEYFDSGLSNANNNINSTFEGKMVFTYGNGSSTQAHFYDMDAILAQSTSADHLFVDATPNPNAMVNNDPNALWNKVNDPIIDTFYNTTAYVEAFKSKLKGPHVDVTDQNLTVTGNGTVNNGCIIDGPDNIKFWLLGEYYPLDNNENRLTVTRDNKTYYICYHKIIINNNDRCLRVAQNNEDSTLYLINDANQFTGYYIGTKEVEQWGNTYYVETIFNASGNEDLEGYNQFGIKEYSSWQFNYSARNSSETSNIFHIDSKFQGVNNTTITIGELSADENNLPLYIIVDSSINGVITVKVKNNVRPVILAYFGTANINLDLQGTTNLTVYAPYGSVGYSPDYEPIHLEGNYYGNIIAKRIAIQASGHSGNWHQTNFLQNDEDIAAATSAMLNALDVKTVPDEIKEAIRGSYASALNVQVSDMMADNFYSKLSFEDKQTLYRTWRTLRQNPDYADYIEMLWPWNEHFDLEVEEGGSVTVNSDTVVRLINPLVENNPYFSESSNI